MRDETTKRLQDAINEVIKSQVLEANPPETKETLLRLLKEGFSEQQALQLIGHVVAAEVFGVMQKGQPYVEERYIQKLKQLPALPWKERKSH